MTTEVKHTAEPWVTDEREDLKTNIYSDDATGSIIGCCPSYQYAPRSIDERKANARRIVACVNACAGIDTAHLENHGLPDFAKQISSLVEQRDQLLAALEQITDQYGTERNEWDAVERVIPYIMQIANAAIAAAKGGAV